MYPIYVRGLTYLAMNRGQEAVAEFTRLLAHPGLYAGDPVEAAVGGSWRGLGYSLEIQFRLKQPAAIF